ncbi:Sec-independent protein translocase protein TatB [Mycoavidus sp. SF9855]|uniref:Sec-independent protein translocase protein TatB n=1 Tax=Mycoavidus sp. SF9855 TaxID=2968475 RepID=UPI00211C4A21|nr:Sec-independent protein translocase protein TatB [Mycoavidus sp. SF9855]UUM21807.1 Sec-independent protein translocase protein TatB [Mycoavidus sp. SF9855]
MFDLGLAKLVVIGVVALIVLGPQRLPRVARTAGTLLGRAQRYISEVKAEVSREIEVEELRKMHAQFEQAAQQGEPSFYDAVNLSPEKSATVDSTLPSIRRPATLPKRSNWRIKQSVLPVWYKRTARKRVHVQSAAARMVRYKPASLRRFF